MQFIWNDRCTVNQNESATDSCKVYLKKEKEIPVWICPGFWPCLTQAFQKHTHKNVLPFSFFFFVYSLYEITDAL